MDYIVDILYDYIAKLNSFNWIEYSIVQDLVIFYYNQSLPEDKSAQYDAINWF